ncbi:hypothetical protein B0H19DRAFT_1384818 [Mycena capillaripes]|nr:hypothetical protein B0H19DRAFT_1384818 [Mycena capillaripes]
MTSNILGQCTNVSSIPCPKDVAGQIYTQRPGNGRSRSQSTAGSIVDVRFLPFNLSKAFSSHSTNTTPARTRPFHRSRSAYLGTNSVVIIPTSRAAVIPLRAFWSDSPVFAIKAAKYGASPVSIRSETPAPGTRRPRCARPLSGYFYRVDEDEEELDDHMPEVREALHVNAIISAVGYRYEPINVEQAVRQ